MARLPLRGHSFDPAGRQPTEEPDGFDVPFVDDLTIVPSHHRDPEAEVAYEMVVRVDVHLLKSEGEHPGGSGHDWSYLVTEVTPGSRQKFQVRHKSDLTPPNN